MSEFGTSSESELNREREPGQMKKKKMKKKKKRKKKKMMMMIKETSEVFAAVEI
jgi:hypothetical protein